MFGGSTMWGYGARDEYTIPSQLANYLDSEDKSFKIQNLGQLGYISTQSVIRLFLEIQRNNMPDIVIFYDGVNDVFAKYAEKAGMNHSRFKVERILSRPSWVNLFEDYIESSPFLNLVRSAFPLLRESKGSSGISREELELCAEETIDEYLANVTLVQKLAKAYNFQAFFLWQPIIFFKETLTPFEKTELNNTMGRRLEDLKFLYKRTDSLLNENSSDVINLSHLFQKNDKLIFLDPWHVNESGNKHITEAILEILQSMP
jgi:lysophospholipase L1-like esterase